MRIWRNLVIPLCLFLAAPLPAGAQQEKQTPSKSVQLEGITVTATKEEEKVQEIPTSITAFSDTQVDDSRMNFVKDLGLRVPNLSFYSGGTSVINFPTMRGVRSDPHNNISGVSLYVDDVPVTSNLGFVSDLYDIERIEVLRGPQGTLYGRSKEAFGNDQFVYILAETDGVFTPDAAGKLKRLAQELESRVPFLRDLNWVGNAEHISAKGDAVAMSFSLNQASSWA